MVAWDHLWKKLWFHSDPKPQGLQPHLCSRGESFYAEGLMQRPLEQQGNELPKARVEERQEDRSQAPEGKLTGLTWIP